MSGAPDRSNLAAWATWQRDSRPNSALLYTCPRCQAPPRTGCRSTSGTGRATSIHAARRALVDAYVSANPVVKTLRVN